MTISTTLRENMLTLAKAYARGTKCTLSATSKKFYGNTTFFKQFGASSKASGKKKRVSVSIDKYGDIVEQMRAEWPPGVDWPVTQAIIIPPK